MKKLTPQQDKFAQLVASGMNQSESYRRAYPKSQQWKNTSVKVKACRLAANLRLTISQLRDENRELAKLTIAEKYAALAGVVKSPVEGKPAWSDKLRAIDLDNMMSGDYEEKEQQVNVVVVIGGNADE